MLTNAKGIARLLAVGLALAIFPFFAQAGGHPAKAKEEEKEMEKEEEAGGEDADVQVTSLKVISNSCQ